MSRYVGQLKFYSINTARGYIKITSMSNIMNMIATMKNRMENLNRANDVGVVPDS